MTPASSSRFTRSAALGDDRPMSRARSATVTRALAAKAVRIAISTSSRPPFLCLRRFTLQALQMMEISCNHLLLPIPNGAFAAHHGAMTINSASLAKIAVRVPPHAWFGISAIFHYLGPSFAVLLFPAVGVLGVAWMRIASAAAVFALWSNPWRVLRALDSKSLRLLILFGACLAV